MTAYAFWEEGRLTYSELCGLHTEDADVVLYLIAFFQTERQQRAADLEAELRRREIAEAMAEASSAQNALEARRLGMFS